MTSHELVSWVQVGFMAWCTTWVSWLVNIIVVRGNMTPRGWTLCELINPCFCAVVISISKIKVVTPLFMWQSLETVWMLSKHLFRRVQTLWQRTSVERHPSTIAWKWYVYKTILWLVSTNFNSLTIAFSHVRFSLSAIYNQSLPLIVSCSPALWFASMCYHPILISYRYSVANSPNLVFSVMLSPLVLLDETCYVSCHSEEMGGKVSSPTKLMDKMDKFLDGWIYL